MEQVTTAIQNVMTVATTALTCILDNPVLAFGIGATFLGTGIAVVHRLMNN